VLLLELLGLIALLASVFAVAVVVLERDGAFRPPRAPMQKGS